VFHFCRYCDHIRYSGEVSRRHSAILWQRDGAAFGFQQILKKSFSTSEMMNIILSVQIAAGRSNQLGLLFNDIAFTAFLKCIHCMFDCRFRTNLLKFVTRLLVTWTHGFEISD